MRILTATIVVSVVGALGAAPTANAAGGLLGGLTSSGADESSGSDGLVTQTVAPVVDTATQAAEPVTTAGASTVTTTVGDALTPATTTVTRAAEPVVETVAPVVETAHVEAKG